MLVVAYSKTEASALTPFLYFQLVFAAVGGWLVFGEIPDAVALVGGGLIVASGIWNAVRKRTQPMDSTDSHGVVSIKTPAQPS